MVGTTSSLVREYYELIKMYEDAKEKGELNRDRCDNTIRHYKKKIREYNREKPARNRKIIRSDYDEYIEKVYLDKEFESKEDASEYAADQLWIEYQPSAYDCTGQQFTTWLNVFNVNGQWIAYHCVSMDV